MSKDTKPFFPGRVVESDSLDDVGVQVTIYPLGLKHIQKFATNIAGALQVLATTNFSKMGNDEEKGTQIMARLVPYAMTNLLGLIQECSRVTPEDIKFEELPHYVLPDIVTAWIDDNFGEEKKWRPWIEAMNRVVTKITGKPFSISGMVSSYSSPQDTLATTFSE